MSINSFNFQFVFAQIELDYDDKVIQTNNMDFNHTTEDVIPDVLSVSAISLGKHSLMRLISTSILKKYFDLKFYFH